MSSVRTRVAWSMAALAGAFAVADTVFTALRAPLLSTGVWTDHGWPSVTLATFGSALMGALIVSRYPRHPVGWLLVVAGTSSISIASEAYYLWALDGHGIYCVCSGLHLDTRFAKGGFSSPDDATRAAFSLAMSAILQPRPDDNVPAPVRGVVRHFDVSRATNFTDLWWAAPAACLP